MASDPEQQRAFNLRVENGTKIAFVRERNGERHDINILSDEIENAAKSSAPWIVIESRKFGDVVASWITTGNLLHKGAVLSGLAAMAISLLPGVPVRANSLQTVLAGSCAVMSLSLVAIYQSSWQYDPCSRYQVVSDPVTLSQLPLQSALTTSQPTVLTYRNDCYRQNLHNFLAGILVLFYGIKLKSYLWSTLSSPNSSSCTSPYLHSRRFLID